MLTPKFCSNCGCPQHRIEPEAAVGDLTISLYGECWWKGKRVNLTRDETIIVLAMATDPGCFLTMTALASLYGGSGAESVRSHIGKMKPKFRAVDPDFDRIEGKHSFGYRWRKNAPLVVVSGTRIAA
jgi:DNA-binding response OmpR family regulator